MISKILVSCLLFSFFAMAAQGQDDIPELLSEYQWNNRLLLLFAPDHEDEKFKNQLNELKGCTPGLRDRDVKIFRLFASEPSKVGDQPVTNFDVEVLYQRYGVGFDEFTVMLIGKDGTVKYRQKEILPAELLFRRIDALPMRRREIKQDG